MMLMVDGSGTPPDPTPPTVTTLAPASAVAGSPNTDIVITGSNFDDPSHVTFGGVSVTSTWTSATSVTAHVPAAQLTTAGNKQVRIGSSYKMFTIT
jgi:hypothetical protein